MGLVDTFFGQEKKKKTKDESDFPKDESDFLILVVAVITVVFTLWFTGQIDRILNARYYDALDNGYRAMEWCELERNYTSCCAETCSKCIEMFEEEFHTNWTFNQTCFSSW